MERLVETWRPQTLSDVCGQSEVVETLEAFAANPYAKCWLLTGPPGTGKSSCAVALIRALGADQGWPGYSIVDASDMGIDALKEHLKFLQCSFLCPKRPHWHVLVAEELARLSPQCQEMAKSQFELGLGERAIVIATSNDVSSLQDAFLERFSELQFVGDGEFITEALNRGLTIWKRELRDRYGIEQPTPDQLRNMADKSGKFSFRRMLDQIEQRVVRAAHNAKPASQRRKEADANVERIGL